MNKVRILVLLMTFLTLGVGAAVGLASAAEGDKVAVVVFRDRVLADDAVSLARANGVRIEAMYCEYLGGTTPVTTGVAVGPAEDIEAAVARYRESTESWFELRLANMAQLTLHVGEPQRQMIARASADVRAAQAEFAREGLRVGRLQVRGSPASIQRLSGHPSITAIDVR